MKDIKNFLKEKLDDKYNENYKELTHREYEANLKNWHGDSVVKDVLYHGSVNNFDRFDIKKSSHLSYIGRGFYFSSSILDVNSNYANTEGEDLNIKINFYEERVNKLLDSFEGEYGDEYSEHLEELLKKENFDIDAFKEIEDGDEKFDIVMNLLVREKLGNIQEEFTPVVYPVFIKMENPFYADQKEFFEEENTTDDFLNKIVNHPKIEKLREEIEMEEWELIDKLREAVDTHLSYYYGPGDEMLIKADDDYIEDADFSDFEDDVDIKEMLYEVSKEILNSEYENGTIRWNSDPEGVYTKLTDALDSVLLDAGIESTSLINNVKETLYERGYKGIDFEDYKQILSYHNIEDMLEGYSLELHEESIGGANIADVLRQAIQRLGYDGFIMDAGERFKNMKDVYSGETMHYIVFNPNQIKSAIGNNGMFNPDDDRFAFRLNEYNKNISTAKINNFEEESIKIVNQFEKELDYLKGKIKVYKNEKDIPNNVLEQFNKSDNKATALLDKNTDISHIFLFNIKNTQELEKTIAHETIGHIGIKRALGDKYENYLTCAYKFYDKKGELDTIKRKYSKVYNSDKDNYKKMIVEEKIAETIEKYGMNKIPFYKTVIGSIRNSIRKILPSIDLKINQSDIDYLIERSYKSLKNKKEEKKNLFKLR